MRALRNLNPRYEADSWLPAGATLNATTKIVGLYNRHCMQGPRAELARTLVMSDAASAIVRVGDDRDAPTTPVAACRRRRVAPARRSREAAQQVLPRAARRNADGDRAASSSATRGELAQANRIKAPRYAIRPGQKL